MTPPASSPAALAGLGLPGAPPGPARPLDDASWDGLLAAVRRERLQGLLAHAVTSEGWAATPEQVAEARAAHLEAMAGALALDRRLAELAPALDEAGVRWRALKGAALAHLAEPDPSWRCYGDVDLLVHGDDLATVLHLLTGLGGVRHYPARPRDFDRRFGKGAAVTLPDGIEVDVHRTIALGPYGLALDPRLLLDADPTTFHLGARAVPALDPAGRFLHACYHAALGRHPPRLSAVRDVARTFPTDDAGARAAHRLARAAGGEAVVAVAVVDAIEALGWAPTGPLADWCRRLRPAGRDRRWLAAYRGDDRSSWARTLLGAEAVAAPADRVAYVRSVVADVGVGELARRAWDQRVALWDATSRR